MHKFKSYPFSEPQHHLVCAWASFLASNVSECVAFFVVFLFSVLGGISRLGVRRWSESREVVLFVLDEECSAVWLVLFELDEECPAVRLTTTRLA